ncbi:t-SNARE domain-containing protein 1-like isoform X1 [Lethenteron reissneri]|uniref:t-SNARE domain-containing protein 1-like isoform X1 n=1 Tax=Lethenteron reissneri TaxID=7753 RepID=UPI002AB6A2EB|nr:t-SNARE domain-containing protein 1-like isoform X1 [Lethenteron reissneri]
MSYGAIGDGKDALLDPHGQESQAEEFRELSQEISKNIFQINGSVSALDKQLQKLGATSDSSDLRQQLHNQQQRSNQLITDTASSLRHLADLARKSTKQDRLQLDRLKSQFSETLKSYQQTQKKISQKTKEVISSEQRAAFQQSSQDEHGWERKKMVSAESTEKQLTHEDLEDIQVRHEAIQQLESDLLDVNSIFKDLASMVHEQGGTIDSIVHHVERASSNVEGANENLVTASKHQAKSRKKTCFIIIGAIVVLGIIGLIIGLTVKK